MTTLNTPASPPPSPANPTPQPTAASAPSPAAPPVRPAGGWRHFLARRWFLVLLILLGVLLLPSVLHWVEYRQGHSITDDAFVEAHIVNVAPEAVSGRIVRFLVEENDHVEAGQVLAELDPVSYRDQVSLAHGKHDTARAEVRSQEAGLARLRLVVPLHIEAAQHSLALALQEQGKAKEVLKLTTDEVDRTIDEARAAVEAARAGLVLAKQEYDRFTALYKQEAVPLRRSQEVTRAHDSARAEVNLAEARLAKALAARTKVAVARRDLEAAHIAAQKARTNVSLAETGHVQIREVELLTQVKREAAEDARRGLVKAENQFQYTQVRAPFPGVVVKRYRHLGDYASAGAPILSMYNPDLLYVTANLEETRLPGVAPGNAVELQVDAFAEPFRGRVVWINKSTGAQFALMPRNVVSGEFTKVVQRVPVRIWIEKDERWPLLRAGLSARVTIAHGDGDAAWAQQVAKDMAQLETRFSQPHK